MNSINNRITDAEFVLLSNIKTKIASFLDLYCKGRSTDERSYPDLKGHVYWIVENQTTYRMVLLIRYVNTSDFKDADIIDDGICNISKQYKGIIYPPYIIKNGEELEVTITIKHPNDR